MQRPTQSSGGVAGNTYHDMQPAIGRVLADRRGATLIEFALVAPMFLFLMLGLLETSLVYFVQENLETAAEDTLRSVAVGRYSAGGDREARLAQAVCSDLPSFLECSQLQLDIASVPTPAQVGQVHFPPLTARVGKVQLGGPGDMIVVRLLYRWRLRLSPLSAIIRGAEARDGYVLEAIRVAKAESYQQ